MVCMSAGDTTDSGDAMPGYVAGCPEVVEPAGASPCAAAAVKPKARTKRPRPCFDDGALTRVFKFPSRAYPRSSHYVTGDEIIIRIKKGRRKWKLVVPKKRVVSYRTNRWFAKQRWVEIELTFTQACRFGLAAPRTPPRDTPAVALEEPRIAAEPACAAEAGDVAVPELAQEPEWASLEETVLELGPEAADHEPPDDGLDEAPENEPETTSELVAGHLAGFDAAPAVEPVDAPAAGPSLAPEPAMPLRGCELEQSQPPLPLPDIVAACPPVPLAAEPVRPRIAKPKGWANAAVASAASVLVLAGVSGVWLMPGLSRPQHVAETLPACEQGGSAADCTEAIVTGSVETKDRHYEPATAHGMPEEAPPPLTDTSGPERAPAGAEAVALPAAAIPPAIDADAPDAATNSPHKDARREMHASLPEVAPVDPGGCRELGEVARSISIRFGYASARIDFPTRALLTDLAGRLRTCPSARLFIEGHTDADGHASRNEALSLRRAEAVRRHLVEDGVEPDRLTALGFGPSRPDAPNVGPENKRRNRRAAFSVEIPR